MSSDGSLMPIRMLKALYPNTKRTDPNISIDDHIIFHTYNNACIAQMRVCKVNIINKWIKHGYSFFVGPGSGPALLRIPDCERLQLLRINSQTMKKWREVKEQTKQDDSKINNDFKINQKLNHNMEIGYFIAGPETEADMVVSAKTAQIMHNGFSNVFTGIRCFKGTFSLQVKYGAKAYQAVPRHLLYVL